MKLSTRARYALRAMIVIAQEGKDGGPVNLGVVAAHTGVSRRYLEQVSIALKSAGLLKGVSGKHGGHLLGRPAREISLLEIVEAAIGPINVVECASNPEACSRNKTCDCRALYRLINHQLSRTLAGFSLDDLAQGRVRLAVEAEIGLEPEPASRGK
jgi:Rrf2 family protein